MRSHDPELNIIKAVVSRRSFDGALFRSLRGAHFRDDAYGTIWDYLVEHHRRFGAVPAQETLLIDHPDIRDYLLGARAPEPAEFYADKILEAYTTTGVATRLAELIPRLEVDVNEGITEISQALAEYRLIRSNVAIMTLANTASERMRAYNEQKVYGIPFGWDTLDSVTMGAHPGDLIAIVARSGQGKTFCTLKVAHTAWLDDQRVLFIATEIPAMKIMSRFDAMHMKLDYGLYQKRLLTDSQMGRLAEYYTASAVEERYERFHIVDGTGITPAGLATLIDQIEPDIVFIDSFFDKMQPNKRYDTRQGWTKMEHLANELKDDVALRYKIPVVVNAQFNREVGTTFGGARNVEGGLEHIAGGDYLGRQADLVLSISRSPEEMQAHALKMRIIKGRETADGLVFHVGFDFRTMNFDEVDITFAEGDEEREEKASAGKGAW